MVASPLLCVTRGYHVLCIIHRATNVPGGFFPLHFVRHEQVLFSPYIPVFRFLLVATFGRVRTHPLTCGCEMPPRQWFCPIPSTAPTKPGNEANACRGTRSISSVLKQKHGPKRHTRVSSRRQSLLSFTAHGSATDPEKSHMQKNER